MSLPYNWRVTKYDPALRNPQGNYLGDDWASISDIGRSFAGKLLTYEDYFASETAYVEAAMGFMEAAGFSALQVKGLNNSRIGELKPGELRDIALVPALVQSKTMLEGSGLADIIRMVLREILWCRLMRKSQLYLFFGWDYYMYIGSTSPSHKAIESARKNGLFVEEMISPYLSK
jgi:hypothetical protein